MPIREIQLPRDFSRISRLLSAAFEYPDNPEWTAQENEVARLSNTVVTLQMSWPVIKFFRLFSRRLRNSLLGYLWEEDGEAVGLVTISRRGRGKNWQIESLGVLPEYRRRGIGRELAEAALALMRTRGGTFVVQSVPDGNLPVIELYKAVGLEKFSEVEDFTGTFDQAPPLPKVPDGYRHKVVPMRDWKTGYDLTIQVTPALVQEFDPVTKDRFYISPGTRFLAQIFAKMRGTLVEDFALIETATGEVQAMGYLRAEGKRGRHSLGVVASEEHADLVPFLLDYALYVALNLSTDTEVEVSLPEWREFAREELLAKGFQPGQRWYRMGMKFN